MWSIYPELGALNKYPPHLDVCLGQDGLLLGILPFWISQPLQFGVIGRRVGIACSNMNDAMNTNANGTFSTYSVSPIQIPIPNCFPHLELYRVQLCYTKVNTKLRQFPQSSSKSRLDLETCEIVTTGRLSFQVHSWPKKCVLGCMNSPQGQRRDHAT